MLSRSTELCKLASKWTTDKALFYTPFYHELLKDRRNIKKVLEFGIGYPEIMHGSVARLGLTGYITGASLFMWQEYFPEAQIFALDNRPETFINEGRIQSFYCDQGNEDSFNAATNITGGGFDLIIDDGSHIPEHQILSTKMLVPLLNEGGIYVAEDVNEPFDVLQSKISFPSEIKTFYRSDLPEGQNTAAVLVIRK